MYNSLENRWVRLENVHISSPRCLNIRGSRGASVDHRPREERSRKRGVHRRPWTNNLCTSHELNTVKSTPEVQEHLHAEIGRYVAFPQLDSVFFLETGVRCLTHHHRPIRQGSNNIFTKEHLRYNVTHRILSRRAL